MPGERSRALILGASFSGSLWALLLRRAGWEVDVVDRRVDLDRAARLPHLAHAHLLGTAPRAITRWIPDFDDRLSQAGARGPIEQCAVSRPLLDRTLRAAAEEAGVTWKTGWTAHRLEIRGESVALGCRDEGGRDESGPDDTRRGVVDESPDPASIDSDEWLTCRLFVDAGGGAGFLARRLGELTGQPVACEELPPGAGYSTFFLDSDTCAMPTAPADSPCSFRARHRELTLLAQRVEHGRWLLSLQGRDVPRSWSELRPRLIALLGEHPSLVARIPTTPLPRADFGKLGGQRFVLEAQPSWPGPLLAVGDAVCRTPPRHGLGLSLSARMLERVQSELAPPLIARDCFRLQCHMGQVVQEAWEHVALRQALSGG